MNNYNFELDLSNTNTMSIINKWIEDGCRVLEFGSANGRLTKHLALHRKCSVTIVEIDAISGQEAAQYATKSYIGAELGDINKFYWYNDTFQYDYIIFADVLEHLPNPDTVLEKCKSLLAPQGAILVSIPNIAHNSVLIDLFNDNFTYQDTGLLDSSHIHFFTYHSFYKMVTELNLFIVHQQPVYSRVGWNEIQNNYDDISYVVEQELRERKSGSIYQYVLYLQPANATTKSLSFNEIVPFSNDLREEEATCFFVPENKNTNDFIHIGVTYFNDITEHHFRFSIGTIVKSIRFDPLESSGIVIIHNIKVKPINNIPQDASVSCHNASYNLGNIFYFKNPDPQIEIDIDDLLKTPVEYVEVHCQLLASHLASKYENIYDTLFKNFFASLENDTLYQEAVSSWAKHTKKSKLQEELNESKNYEDHLLSDIQQLKQELTSLQKESSEYISHCEKDLARQTQYIDKMEENLREKNIYIKHLETDLDELKKYTRHLEADIKTLNDQIQKMGENGNV